jgi:hypothetical protein
VSEQFVQVPPQSTGLKMRVQEVTAPVSGQTVEMENVVLSDPTTPANMAAVTAASALKVDGSGVTQPVSGTFFQGTQPVSLTSTTITGTVADNLTQVAGTNLGATAVVNYGTTPAAAAVPGVNAFITNTPAVTLTSTTITGTVAATESGTWTVQPGNTANSTPWLVTQSPATTGGLTVFHLASAASTNATNVKASAGQLYGYMVSNTSAAYTYLCFHNTAGTPTAGASIFFKIGIPSGGAANVHWNSGIAFGTGIAITTVVNPADSDATAVAANDQVINLFYK